MTSPNTRYARDQWMNFETRLRQNAHEIYEMPVAFWRKLLGTDLHFHLGHFPTPDTTLSESMQIAVRSLAAQIPIVPIHRVLDIGCGWGGPAFDLAKLWNAEIACLTISKHQARFVNEMGRRIRLPVRATTVDVEGCRLSEFGVFDVVWLYEVLEHVIRRRQLLLNLHQSLTADGILAIALSCRAPEVERSSMYSDILGVLPIDSLSEFRAMLLETGWEVISTRECTCLTLPVWDYWIESLMAIKQPRWQHEAVLLAIEFLRLRELYRVGVLQSVQIVATPGRSAPP